MTKENSFLLENWLVNHDNLTIQNKHQHKSLDSKVMQLLCYLVAHRERVVSRNELLDQLWQGQVVADDVLNVAISNLRKALGDDFKQPIYIRTIPRKGYQLIASVCDAPKITSQTKQIGLILGFFILMFTALITWQLNPIKSASSSTTKLKQPLRLAVLPFDYFAANDNYQYLADGLTEAVINQLVQESNLLVTSRTSVMFYKNKQLSTKHIANELNVQWLIEGSIQITAEEIQITAQLIDAHQDSHLWSETYRGELDDLITIQTQIAEKISARLTLSSQQQLIQKTTQGTIKTNEIPLAAYDYFLKGRYFHYQGESDNAIAAYQQAISIYPDYAEAYAHIAHEYFAKAYANPDHAKQFINQASRLTKQAAQLNQHSAYIQLVIALNALYHKHNYQKAGQAFQLTFSKNNHNLLILEWYAEYLLITEQFEQALQLAQHMKDSSPLAYNKITAYRALYYQKDFAKAEQELINKSAILSENEKASLYFWHALATNNNELLLTYAPTYLTDIQLTETTINQFLTTLKHHQRESALNVILNAKHNLSEYDQARLYAWAGQTDKAMSLLANLVANKNIQVLTLAIEPAFNSLKNHTGYQALLKQLNL